MDRELFDSIARHLGAAGTRRAALAALLGTTALAVSDERGVAAKRRKKRKNKKKKPSEPTVCFGSKACPPPASGKDLDDCDYSGTNVFVDAVAAGSSFRRSNFAGATLDGADLQGTKFLNANLANASLLGVDVRGASFNGACLLNADFTDLIFEGPVLADAIQCNTRTSATEVLDRDCANLTACCRA